MEAVLDKSEDINKRVNVFLGSLHQRFGESKSLHDLGVNDELASNVHDFFSNPIKALLEAHLVSLNGLSKIVRNLIEFFLKTQKESINKAFEVEAEGQLVYYICLKNDCFEARDPYFEFIEVYEELGLKSRLPLTIKFVPERVLHKVELEELVLK